MVFEELMLSKSTIDRLSQKVNFPVQDEDSLCFAITRLLDLHDNQRTNIKDLLNLLKENGIKVV